MNTTLTIKASGPEGCGKTTALLAIEKFIQTRFSLQARVTSIVDPHVITFEIRDKEQKQEEAARQVPLIKEDLAKPKQNLHALQAARELEMLNELLRRQQFSNYKTLKEAYMIKFT